MMTTNYPSDKNYKPTGPRSFPKAGEKHKENHTKAFHKLMKNSHQEKVIKQQVKENTLYTEEQRYKRSQTSHLKLFFNY